MYRDFSPVRCSYRHILRFLSNKRAVSAAISTVILTGAIVAMVIVASVFANRFLETQMAENEFNAMKQFMQTLALQIDDVAWIIGRTQTTRYASTYGQVNLEPSTLNYAMYVWKDGTGWVSIANYSVGIILFNMPVSAYSLGNNYYERLLPSSGSLILQKGTSASVCYVYIIEKLPMPMSDNFIRIVVAPSIRMLNSTISTGEVTKNYFKFYLPVLSAGTNPRYSQSVTLTGSSVSVKSYGGSGNKVKINVTFPRVSEGFNDDFFRFGSVEEIVNITDDSIVEFFTGGVVVSLGLYA